jgi:hypothetical protein
LLLQEFHLALESWVFFVPASMPKNNPTPLSSYRGQEEGLPRIISVIEQSKERETGERGEIHQ